MCLHRVTKLYEPRKRGIVKAWKMVRVTTQGILTPHFLTQLSKHWTRASNDKIEIYTDPWDIYPSGFHVFTTKKAAEKAREEYITRWPVYDFAATVIIPVQIDEIICRGIDDTAQDVITLVAKKIRLLPKKKG